MATIQELNNHADIDYLVKLQRELEIDIDVFDEQTKTEILEYANQVK